MTLNPAEDQSTAFVVDTSVFIHDPHCIDNFGDADIVVPLRVVEELDELKSKMDARGAYAREASRVLENYRHGGDLRKEGVLTEKGGRLFIAYGAESWDVLNGLGRGLERKNDNLILLVAKNWKKHHPDQRVAIITLDTNMRIKAAALDIDADEYHHGEASSFDDLYTGRTDIQMDDEGQFQQFSTELNRRSETGVLALADFCNLETLMPNHCCTIRCNEKYTLAIYKMEKGVFQYVPKPVFARRGEAIKPRNDSQAFAFALALDRDISLLTLMGTAGAGKTLMALLAANELLERYYKRIIVYRPIYEVGGKELGFLPGDLDKKFGPWARPIMDNLELIFEDGHGMEFTKQDMVMADDNIEIKTEKGSINISPIIYIRGRSLHDSYVIVDEAQNLTPNDVKSLVTRAGRGTKVVITGDPTQIDNKYLDFSSNGLVRAIRSFSNRKWDKFAHIHMEKSERSELADIGAQIL